MPLPMKEIIDNIKATKELLDDMCDIFESHGEPTEADFWWYMGQTDTLYESTKAIHTKLKKFLRI